MGEIKSVKVDNWGVFFLQKLQNFFNKTDYCDLTLQFNDNSQLKVHRLVLSACTDYFNVLEQTCEMIDDVLIMPLELQADVVVPIVNFMYTGTLEFELRMYGRLLKTARDMNMTVLLKLLEAHRRTMERNPPQPLNRNNQRNSGMYQRKISGSVTSNASSSLVSALQRRAQSTSSTTTYKSLQIKPITSYYSSTAVQNTAKYTQSKAVKGPSRFDYPPEGKVLPPETFEQSFDTISYESKPLICKEEPDSEDYEGLIQKHSPFEELRRGYNNNKRPASSISFESPPEKKPNIEDVKEYAEQQRVRKQIAQEFDDDNEYDETLDDEFHHDDDDEDYVPPPSYQKQAKQHQTQQQKQQQQHQKLTGAQQQPIVIKQENNRPTIVVKDSPNSNVNHAKIISEVLRKYPHLVKNNKNIKLKILPKSGTGKGETQKIVLKKEVIDQRPMTVSQLPPPGIKHNTYPSASQRSTTIQTVPAGTSLLQQKQSVQPKTSSSVKTTATESATSPSATNQTAPSQPRRIDSKTMHSLIAMGAENRTGPWLCLRCGVNGRPISIPSYRGFRRHLINTHQEKIDPRLCEHCGWRSTNNRELYHHMLVEHKIKPPTSYNFPKCELCDAFMLSYSDLEKHIAESHEEGIEVNQNCIYCNRIFANESMLYAHMKSQHKDRAKEDGVIDFSDDEIAFESDSQLSSQYHSDGGGEQKIKILSDISLPKNIPIIQAADNAPGTTITLPPEVLEANTKIIDTSQGPRFVNADGKEMELTDEQRQEIISQLEDQDHGAVVMVLNDETINEDATQIATALSGANTSSADTQSSDSSKSKSKTPVAEKELHKPRKTKHTVKTEIDDIETGEEMIEWLDEESGNIMKVPLSKFSKMGEVDEEDEETEVEEAERETEEGESADESKNTSKTRDDSPLADIKNESLENKKLNTDEATSDTVKEKVSSSEDKSKKSEGEKSDESQKEPRKIKDKGEISKAMETLKILTGDWTDEEEDEEHKGDERNVESEKDQSKDEEILFETIAIAEMSTKSIDDYEKRKDNDNCNKLDESETEKDDDKNKKKNDGTNDKDEMNVDTSISTEQDIENVLKTDVDESNKFEDVMDDDMKIIEELKNYEAEQLIAEQESKDKEKTDERQLRQKSKSKSKSASPAMSEHSNSSGSVSSATGDDKLKKRGRPRKTSNLEKQKSTEKDDSNEVDTQKEDKREEESTEKEKEDDEKESKKDGEAEIKQSAEENENSQGSEESGSKEDKIKSETTELTEQKSVECESDIAISTTAVADNDNSELMTKAEIRNLISDWGDDDDDDL